MGAAPMWASKATYLTQLGQVYAKLTDQAVEAIIVRFFGFFFLGKNLKEPEKLILKKLFFIYSMAVCRALGKLDFEFGFIIRRSWIWWWT